MFTTIFVQPLLNIMFAIYAAIPGHDFGIAVILLTLIVRLILWPLVTRQLHSQRLIQQMQPEVARLREQAAGDKQKETELLMELYKEKGTNPFASLLLLIIQLPIIYALYIALRDSVDPHRIGQLAYPFVAHLGPVSDIINHHVAFHPSLLGFVDLTKPSVVLAVVAALSQYFQARMLQPMTTAAAGDQARMMQGMTLIFPFITFIIGLKLPAALALYWAVTSLAAAFQQYWVLLRDVEEMEEETGGVTGRPAKVVAPAKQPRPKRKKAKGAK